MCLKKISIFLVFVIAFSSGCIDANKPTVGSPKIELSSPYQINPGKIRFLIDSNVTVPINHTGNYKIKIEIIQANQIIEYEDGRKEIINGFSNPIILNPYESRDLEINFNQIPVEYELKSNPLRLHPVIDSYKTYVKYKGSGIKYGFRLKEEINIYEKTINLDDKPIDIDNFVAELK